MKANVEYLTAEKFKELEKELKFLKTEKRKEIAEHLEYARSLGDLSENAEYQEAREEQGNVEDRIAKLEAILKSTEIISANNLGKEVTAGSMVTVHKEGQKESQTYTIVGSEEADMLAGKISIRSPFGIAILGKKKGDDFSFTAPAGEVKYKITNIK